MKPFRYISPKTIEEACSLIEQHSDARVLAGGQSLIPLLKLNMVEISYLVDLKRVPELVFIQLGNSVYSDNKEALFVGALTTYSDIARSPLVKKHIPLLAETARSIGHALVRNRGTIGGSLSHCDPVSDLCTTSLALDARMIVARKNGERRMIHAQDFFTGPFATAMERGEILEKVCYPIPKSNSHFAFEKFSLGHSDFPLTVVSVLLSTDSRHEKCESAAIAVGGASDCANRILEAEQELVRNDISPDTITRVARIAANKREPASDLETSAAYKKRLMEVLVRRALTKALGME